MKEIPHILSFETQRLTVEHWDETLNDACLRSALVEDLAGMLTRPVLKHLPPSLRLGTDANAIEHWICARWAECDVYLVTSMADGKRVGLMILVCDVSPDSTVTLHFGYLFSEPYWGRGYASELARGLVCELKSGPSCILTGGVAVDNLASARVLVKAGFSRDVEKSTDEMDIFVFEI